ncbi:uncharacterized protein PODANS_1_11990 [Podospora anserina S mat+]|uniref:Podospora anserina S mat+ genomic DNA chromosome 1, supercontig 2 n=1 Tax=Podospora anserina (strain S / ATCC MYA-4624 / DSM 980 / FGSC 10383) TaxID=515849 RepID=B2AYR6_PODAN|nr:uncharacterized protein PODANS_1_11990 [Podospora anserina S mat+]CAP69540.1 unnamed protein product [Podospora anserina S mat+]CDP23557.1 Putative protein of unknown function [Podospora anserina S mat+]
MSSSSTPITPSAFASALPSLPLPSLHLKVLELRNSIAHLDYSNEQLHPFAHPSSGPPDPVCVEAISENNIVIARMQERISLVKAEVETRGLSWTEFQSKEEIEKLDKQEPGVVAETNGERHSAWTDGTFQAGRIVNGEVVMDDVAGGGQAQQGGSIGDEELRRRMEERMRDMGVDDEEGGMHL